MKRDVEMTDGLINRYLAGEASPEEAIAINAWRAEAGNRARYEELKAVWDATHPAKKGRSVNTEAAWYSLENRMFPKPFGPARRVARMRISFVLRVAAAVAVMLTSVALIYLYLDNDPVRDVALSSGNSIMKVSLPDGSTATLHHHSALVHPRLFPEDERVVSLLEGEAFFDVSADALRPFVVHTSLADIHVAGTSFNVVSGRDSVMVAVREGKVGVFNSRDSVTLEGGWTASMSANQTRFHVVRSVDRNAWGYATGRLSFDDARISEVADYVEKTYSCTIVLKDSAIEDCKLTASFDDDSAQNILNLIAETLNLSVSQNGSVFTLEGEGCH